MPIIQRSFAELVTDLRMRRRVGDRPPILLLGAGASIDAGIGAMPELFEFFGCANFKTFCKYIETTTASERYRYLSEFLQTRKPGEVSPGYQALASLLRDLRVRELLESAGGSIWFTHPKAVPAHLKKTKAELRVVVDSNCAFEKFFPALAKSLEVEVPQEPLDAARLELHSHTASARGAQTMDDLMTSIFAVALPSGIPSSTAFLLAEPRVIVCDRFAVEACITHGKAKLIASGQRHFDAQVLRTDETHPFGPTLLEPPADLHALGMRITTAPMRTGSLVQVAVAAGEKTGISTGTVTQPQLDPQAIAPLRQSVPNLVELRCVVAPGSSGAPVVDDSMAVRAFVVAGSSDDTNPRTFAYPAQCWKASLA